MQIKVFDVLAKGGENAFEEVNRFLRGHKVLDVDKKFYVTSDNVGHWSLFVTYLPDVSENGGKQSGGKKSDIDYREVLSAEDFAKYAKLREIRKQLHARDGVPAYSVFTNAELALIAQLPNIEEMTVMKMSGIDEKRIEKYGKVLCEIYKSTEGCDVSET